MLTYVRYCLAAWLLLALVQPAAAVPSYNIVALGFDDLEHTSNDGYKYSIAHEQNEAAQVIGYSERYNGDSTYLGQSAWLYDGTTTVNIGLTGTEHTSSDGYKYSDGFELNQAGQVIGYSNRYNGVTDLGQSAWLYDGATTVNIGLTGAEHTSSDGYKYSDGFGLNQAGQVIGYSNRYNGVTDFGQSAWLYDGATTVNIGLTGTEHTSSDGYKYSYGFELNQAGQVIGYSNRYNGVTDFGQSAWLFDGATTVNIGLIGTEHTSSDGYKYSITHELNEAAQVIGYSERYNGGSTFLGYSAWLFDGAMTVNIGLTGTEHTRSDGYNDSDGFELNQAGKVIGYSKRYSGGSTYLGQSAWLYDGATTVNIGLTGTEHTRNDGYKDSSADELNQAGQVIGRSERYNGGSTNLGQSAWLYDGATTVNIGLTGTEHTRNDGYKESDAAELNEAGQVIGYSKRYNGGSTNLGQSAWRYNGATTVNIGLTGTEHTRNDGYKDSSADELNQAGQVIGRSERYNGGSTNLGQSAWLYDGATTVNIGLTGTEHTRNDGYKDSSAAELNEAGQVIGYSERYNGGSTSIGQDAWFYDTSLGQTLSLNLSTSSDGYAYSDATYLGEDGLVLGSYTLFDAQDNDLGSRAFYFTIADGLHDLGSLVAGGMAANGWDFLASTIRASATGQILGYGKLNSQSFGQMSYLLIPIDALPGDFNHDGTVDAADYVVWRKTDGTPAGYSAWRTHFGQPAGSSSDAGANATVPEPATFLVLLFTAAGWCLRRGRVT